MKKKYLQQLFRFIQVPEAGGEGIALIISLWITVILSGIILTGTYITRIELRSAYYPVGEIQALGIAYAGIENVKTEIYNDVNGYDSLNESWKHNPEKYNVELGGGNLIISVEDEESKININNVPASFLEKLFPIGEAWNKSEMIDSINDWKDYDSNVRPNGAEEGYYQNLDIPGNCKNGQIDSLDELYLIKGFEDKNTIKSLEKLVTVYSDGKVNVNTAPVDVLAVLPGMGQGLARAVFLYRSGPDCIDGTCDDSPFVSGTEVKEVIGEEAFLKASPYITTDSRYFKVRSAASVGRVTKVVEAVLEYNGENINILYWREL